MDLKKLLWYEPETLAEAQKYSKRMQIMFYIMLLALILIYFGVEQINEEVDSCWSELEGYRLSDNTYSGGFAKEKCYVDNGYVYCDIENFSVGELR